MPSSAALPAEQKIWVLLRLGMGWTFLWAFLDKLFGLGFATAADTSWLAGTSPTFGFLKFGTAGPLAAFYQSIAGNAAVDWLYMAGLLFVGAALLLGVADRLASGIGALMMALFYSAALPPPHNPFLDEHLMYLMLLVGFAVVRPGKWFGLGKRWANTWLARKFPVFS